MDLSQQPAQKPDYRLEMLDNELLLYHLNETKILYCNQTASLIWQLCDGTHPISEIVTLLTEAFPEAAATIEADVTATLQQFLDAGCIEMV